VSSSPGLRAQRATLGLHEKIINRNAVAAPSLALTFTFTGWRNPYRVE